MSTPRHLWSGDWRLESDAAASELATRRSQADAPARARPPAPAPPSRPSTAARAAAWLRAVRRGLARWSARGSRARQRARDGLAATRAARGRRLRALSLVTFVTLLSAAAAYAGVSLLVGSGGQNPPVASASPGWLGIDMVAFPFGGVSFSPGGGAVIADVAPGSPAAAAGLEPGDVITQIDNQPVTTPTDVESAIAGLRAGERVQIQYERGAMTDTTQATLAPRPAGYP